MKELILNVYDIDNNKLIEKSRSHEETLYIEDSIFNELDILTAVENVEMDDCDVGPLPCIANNAWDRLIDNCNNAAINYCKNVSNLKDYNLKVSMLSSLQQILDVRYLLKKQLTLQKYHDSDYFKAKRITRRVVIEVIL